MMLWKHYLFVNHYMERQRRLKIEMRHYPKNTVNTTAEGWRFELHELNSPRVRHNRGESILLKQFTSVGDAKTYAETLTPWEKIQGTRNGWKRGNVIVLCKSMQHLPDDETDHLGRRWSILLHGEFVELCSNGEKAQQIGDELYNSDEADLLED